ncbi:Crp/Fnr family transcriptional regulator [Pontixanthobacter aestiaquae]|uniref:Cyclic nucleotide-binding domain-containing protein n=1 Tax=Pontixanthobacter aestiaquae TaxID=1509367 RepID=A0A844Z3E7_9SPHN|nr:Crp/Fnr family transcriptional regulator [Pontixanthobacter aestiaquae]MDN3647238.1 Crp/Fnr family transcriptional regulator [Pontixanthobacter aestiaquae]MXO81786.1 cyclic nucleotide-binding domain-containing protein [Pontixanthobacter aestiaquae]
MMDRDERVAIVQAIFGCEPIEAARLTDNLRFATAEPATTIAFQGDESRDCQLVVAGAVGLHALGSEGQYTQVATVEMGEIFGAFPDAGTHAVEAVAQEAVELLIIGTAQLRELARNHASIATGLAALYAGQLSNVLGRLVARVTLTADGRVYSELFDLVDDDGIIAPIPVVSALAIRAQTARETASKAITKLEKRGVLERAKDHWKIISPRMLEDMTI